MDCKVSLEQLASFRALAESDTLVEAAEKCYKTQPTISHQVLALERQLGVTLYNRYEAGELRLTKAGAIVYDSAMRIFAELGEMEARIRQCQAKRDIALYGHERRYERHANHL